MYAFAVVKLAENIAETTRPTSNHGSVCATAMKMKSTPSPRHDSRITGRRPKRSDIAPCTGARHELDRREQEAEHADPMRRTHGVAADEVHQQVRQHRNDESEGEDVDQDGDEDEGERGLARAGNGGCGHWGIRCGKRRTCSLARDRTVRRMRVRDSRVRAFPQRPPLRPDFRGNTSCATARSSATATTTPTGRGGCCAGSSRIACPARLVGTHGRAGAIPAKLGAVFRDRDELPTAGDLSSTIREALSESDALIVICSPSSARSQWVDAEVRAFMAQGRSDRIFCFIVEGDPAVDNCFAPATIEDGRIPLAADARPEGDGKDRAFLKLVAGILGVGYDALVQRETQRRNRRLAIVTAAALAGMTVTSGLAITAHVARNDAQRRQAQAEDLLGFMLGDLRKKLTTVGRLDLMRTVDDKATTYFAELDPRDLNDRALEEQARSLTGIGQVRLEEGNHEEAMRAFRQAYARTTALAARDPRQWAAPVRSRAGRVLDRQRGLRSRASLDEARALARALSRQRAAAGGDGSQQLRLAEGSRLRRTTTSPCSHERAAARRRRTRDEARSSNCSAAG